MNTDSTLARPVPVVRLIIVNSSGQVLILRRAHTAYAQGSWCLPGGKVDYGETVEQAVAKELREETSLECKSAQFLFYQDSLPSEPGRMHCINLYFQCSVSGELLMNPESSEWAWIGPEDLDKYEIAFRNDEGLQLYWRTKA
jgi:mutator protein MutT